MPANVANPPGVELKRVPIDIVDDHPENPRVVYRDDVVQAIATLLDSEFPRKHALHVRPVDGRFQILSGHHRKQAALKAGLKEIWVWSEELDDQAAYMELATSNNQGELSPLELGIHAFRCVPPSSGGRGKTGGLSDYAKAVGKTKGYVTQIRQAGEVVMEAKPFTQVNSFLDKAKHLSAIHGLPRECWAPACEWLATSTESAKEVEARVATALSLKDMEAPDAWAELPEDWRSAVFPLADCMTAAFVGRYRPSDFARLMDLIAKMAADLSEHEDLRESWFAWLRTNAGADAWDIRKVQEKRVELEGAAWERMQRPESEEAPIEVLLADPPWRYEHAKQNRAIENQYPTATAEEIGMHAQLPWFPALADDCVLFLWTTAPKLEEAFSVLADWGFTYKTHAIWDKERMGMGYWFRSQHELLLVATRGAPPTPAEGNRLPSIFREKRDPKHSRKPSCVYEAIEGMFPGRALAEVYQREARTGWRGFGNEV